VQRETRKRIPSIPSSERPYGEATRDLSGVSVAGNGKVCDRQTPAGDETMAVASFNADGALQQHSLPEAQLRATLNIVPAHAWYALPNGALTFVNERTADYLGLPKDHPLRFGKDTGAEWDSHVALLHEDDRGETRRVWADCLRTGCAGEVIFRVRDAEGGYRWFLSRAEPVHAVDGILLYWIGVNLDIEERKHAEFYLAEGQRLAHTGSWAFLPGGFEYWSPELLQIHGLDPTSKAPTTEEYLALVHPEDREFVERELERMFASRSGFDFTKRIVRPDGSMRHVRCVGRPCRDVTLQKFIGTGIDVTEQEHLTKALQKSKDELRQILDLTPQVIAVFGPYRERLFINRTALDYLGLTLEEWRATAPGAIGHPHDAERLRVQWDRAMSSGSGFEIEVRMRKGDGSYRWFLNRFNPVRDDEGQILRWYVACTDIDEPSGKKSTGPQCSRRSLGPRLRCKQC
jgi:PAS domain S-box-containing protein